jgi:hypothetical protein
LKDAGVLKDPDALKGRGFSRAAKANKINSGFSR